MTTTWLLYSTFPNRAEALSAARQLVEERLVACVNIIDGATSVYRWENEVQEAAEVVLFAKTTAAQVDKAVARVASLHSYDVPCVTAWPLARGNALFCQWVEAETA